MTALNIRHLFLCFIFALLFSCTTLAQTTAFTYQGKLADNNGSALSGNFDFEFKLFDTAIVGTGTQQGATLQRLGVAVSVGIFTVQLDFGVCASCFNGAARFLDIGVRVAGGGVFTQLSERQPISSNPYAIRSLNATAADGLSGACVSCVTSGQIQSVSGGVVTGPIPVASVPGGSTSYVQNTTSQQTASNLHISGNGTAEGTLSGGIVNAITQFNFAGQRMLSAPGQGNLFVGDSAGASNSNGAQNAFVGHEAGQHSNGVSNAFFGSGAGFNNTSGSFNAFFGRSAGQSNTTGSRNTFIGLGADFPFNVTNPIGDYNTLLGFTTNVNTGVDNATAIGAFASVTQSDSLILGSINGVNGASADTRVGIGTTAPNKHLHIVGSGDQQLGIESSDTNGRLWTLQSSSGASNGRFEIIDRTANVSRMSILSTGNVGVGTTSPADKLDVNGDLRVGTGTSGCVKDSDGTVIAGACSSDARLKRDVTPFPKLLDKLSQLQPVHFYWRSEAFPARHLGVRQSFGLVAQEVEKVMPELVTEDEQGFKAVNYSKLPLLNLQAVKELQQANESLKQRLEQQNFQLERQQKQMEALKQVVCLDHPEADVCKH